MAHTLLLLDIDIEIADHHNPALSPDILFRAAKLARGHITLHDVDAVLLIKGNSGDFVETDNVILTDETTLSSGVVDEHLGDGCLYTRDQMRIWRYLLKDMALAGSAGSKLYQVV